ncbi:MAG: biotin--[acetyl-CoA-carboxylase] ligase, partial [Cellulomonadaceae bacterium]|nr:biotin--[acetyl-CoA-carboxylase] ligase [Cellulomonadaceae bacterium]
MPDSLLDLPDWTVEWVATCPSTNEELTRRALAGEVEPKIALGTDHQTAGRGRGERTWVTPKHGALTFSALINPRIDQEGISVLPLFVGIAICRALAKYGFPAALKWPNDILLPANDGIANYGNWRKVGGILCHTIPNIGTVVGIGINVTQTESELPVPEATSLALYRRLTRSDSRARMSKPSGKENPPQIQELAATILRHLDKVCAEWETGNLLTLIDEYRGHCQSIGRAVAIAEAEGGDPVQGVAVGIARDGAIVVQTAPDTTISRHFGDLFHVEL